MATFLQNLTTRRDAIGVELAALNATKAGGLPTARGEGLSVDHVEYRLSLMEELKQLNDLINQAAQNEAADGGNVGMFETEGF